MDGNATSAAQANALALAKVATIVAGLQSPQSIPAVHKKYIEKTISAITANKNLYNNADSPHPVVEVNTIFTGSGHAPYTLHIMLDVDIPPPHSTQRPHFGFEVKLNGARVENSHIWLPAGVLKAGRPAPGTPLETYGFNTLDLEASHPLPVGLGLEVSFRRYK